MTDNKNADKRDRTVALVGLGYVGLPLALAFAQKFKVIGFDINRQRISELSEGHDRTGEANRDDFLKAKENLRFTGDGKELKNARVIIVTVPTPVDSHNIPDLSPVLSASRTVGRNLAPGSVVVYESTVYPGVTRDICTPILEKESGLAWMKDFHVGYSPERINPGDKEHTVTRITKIVSGDDEKTLELLASVYGEVISAGIYRASSIEVAEAAKVIENTQRDLNIALINELAIIFHRLGIDTREVLAAAGTKWNFLKFQPGLVGGHCIGVDPYYLTYRAQEAGYHPEVILSGRRINDNMGKFIAHEAVKLLIRASHTVSQSTILVLGLTFKENVPDIRNSRVIDIIRELAEYGARVLVADSHADREEVKEEYGIDLVRLEDVKEADAVILAVAHEEYTELKGDFFRKILRGSRKVLIDVKGIIDKKELDKDFLYWRL